MNAPWRRDFDAARDPYTARYALGITASGGGGISDAPSDSKLYGRINATWADIGLTYAPIASPTFTGDPKAPTPATADNDTSIATTAFVKAQSYAPLASPAFTGNPTAPTATAGDNDTSIATTAFVTAAVAAAGAIIAPNHGKLAYVSATALEFKPLLGDKIIINGAIKTIPSGGIASLTNGGLSANTTYYVYAYDSSGTITAEFSATAHAKSTTSGNVGTEIKSGDDTRTLIGMIRTNGSSQFADTISNRMVRSWFNRDIAATQANFTTSRSTNSTSFVEVNSEIRNNILIWSDEIWVIHGQGAVAPANNSVNSFTSIAIDSTTTPPSDAPGAVTLTTAAGQNFPFGLAYFAVSLSEGFHYATLCGKTSSGVANYRGGAGGDQCTVAAFVMRK